MNRVLAALAASCLLALLVLGAALGAPGAGAAAADPGPGPPTAPNGSGQIPGPGGGSPSPSPSSGHGGHGGSGGSTPTPTPTPTPTGPPVVPADPAVGAPKLGIDPRVAHVGDRVAVTAGRFTPGELVHVVVYPERIVVSDFQADTSGVLFGRFSVDRRLGIGAHTVEAIGWQSGHVANGSLLVVSGQAAAGGIPTPIVWAIVAGVLAIVGALALIGVLNGWFAAILGAKLTT